MTEGESGTTRGWKTAILAILVSCFVRLFLIPTTIASVWRLVHWFVAEQEQEPRSSKNYLNLLLHPSLPPMNRPLPPLASLHYYGPEGEEEKRLRREMGFEGMGDHLDGENEVMDVDMDGSVGQVTAKGGSWETFSVPRPSVVPSSLGRTIQEPTAPSSNAPTIAAPVTQTPIVVPQPAVPPAVQADAAVVPRADSVQPGQTSALAPTTEQPLSQSTSTPAVPFMSVVQDKGKGKETAGQSSVNIGGDGTRDDDEEIPELDSGSSDFGGGSEDDEL